MSQTEMLNAILSRRIKDGVSQHVSGNYVGPSQLWATSSHRMSFDNTLSLLTEYGGLSKEFALSILESLIGTHERHRVYYYVTVAEEAMKLLISTTITDQTAAGTINMEGMQFDLDEHGKIHVDDLPNITAVREHTYPVNYFVFYLPSIAHILAGKNTKTSN